MELQDLDPKGSPHLEEELIGGNVDLDLLSLFPQICARIMGGSERKASFSKVNNGGERGENVLKRLDTLWGRKPLKKVEKSDCLKWNLHFLREPGLGPGKAGLRRLEAVR